MYCVIQEIELKKSNKHGYPKELKSHLSKWTINGIEISCYRHDYSLERFERPIKKAYKISIHKSYRENGKLKKKQYSLCTINYYDITDKLFSLYDYDNKLILIADETGISIDDIYTMVHTKLDPLREIIENEFSQTEEFKTHTEHERITTIYAAAKIQFSEKYGCDKDKYDEIYDVFGNLMSPDKLREAEAEYKARQEYEDKSRSYQKEYYSNYKDYNFGNDSSYSNDIHSNHNSEDKETLKQFYRVLSKKFHPDANPDADTSKQMQLLNQLKKEWNV